MGTLKSGQPPYNIHSLPIAMLSISEEGTLNNGLNTRPQCVPYLEVPLYTNKVEVLSHPFHR